MNVVAQFSASEVQRLRAVVTREGTVSHRSRQQLPGVYQLLRQGLALGEGGRRVVALCEVKREKASESGFASQWVFTLQQRGGRTFHWSSWSCEHGGLWQPMNPPGGPYWAHVG